MTDFMPFEDALEIVFNMAKQFCQEHDETIKNSHMVQLALDTVEDYIVNEDSD